MLKDDEPFPIAAAASLSLDRRRFLRTAGAAAVIAVGAELAGRRRLERDHSEAITVALTDGDRPAVGTSRAVADASGREAIVVRVDDATVVAFDRRCPHLGCPVLWSAERKRFECPCHHAAFDARTGRVLFGPPRRGLAPARLRIA